MATKLTRPVTRVVTDVPLRGAVVVTLSEHGILFRYPGKRTKYLLPYGVGMLRAEMLAAAHLMAERKKQRAAARLCAEDALMWCGPNAIARLTGWTPGQVWLHIRWLREQTGHRVGPKPRGGTYAAECLDALERAGFNHSRLWRFAWSPDLTYGEFYDDFGKRGRWLLQKRGHFWTHFPRDGAPSAPDRKLVLVSAWLITRKSRGFGRVIDARAASDMRDL